MLAHEKKFWLDFALLPGAGSPTRPHPFYIHTPLSRYVKEFADGLEIDPLLDNHICSIQNNSQLEFLCSFFLNFFYDQEKEKEEGRGRKNYELLQAFGSGCFFLDLLLATWTYPSESRDFWGVDTNT